MRRPPGTPLEIGLLGDDGLDPEPVGRLALADGLAQLQWAAPVIEQRQRIDPLLYPPEAGLHAARGRRFDGLHGFLSDSLPDAWGQLVMKRRLARLGIALDALDAVDRLALVGRSGRGALVYRPATAPNDDSGPIDLDVLAGESRLLLLGEDIGQLDALARLGGSSGGARPKVHVGIAPDGLMEGEGGQEDWIVKFRAANDPVDIGPIEEAYARMARAAGVTVAASRLLVSRDGPGYFATRRFDRPVPGRRLHMISLAAAIEAPAEWPSLDYDGFLRAVAAITRHAGDVREAFRRMVFNILAHNRDDHTRQHSFLLRPDGDWRLAPAYDLTFSTGPGGAHYMAVEGEGRAPTRSQVSALGRRHGIADRAIAEIIDSTRAAIADWHGFASDTGVTISRSTIGDHHRAVATTFG